MKVQRVIMVDDDPCSHMICKGNIRHIAAGIEVKEFICPQKGIEYIESSYGTGIQECPTVMLLDINMPLITGWEFLERYDKFESNIKNQIVIYLLSSSVDPRDKRKAAENKYVKGFLMKPFRKSMIQEIFETSLSPSL